MPVRYRINGREVSAEQFHAHQSRTAIGTVPTGLPTAISCPDSGWELENGGRGHYSSQLQRKPGPEGSDPNAFVRSRGELIEKATRMGYSGVKA